MVGSEDGHGVLNESIDQTVTSWKSRIDVAIAKSRKVRGGNYVQIATVDEDGLPHCRTVVFRGFHEFPSLSPSVSEAEACTTQTQTTPRLAMKMITDNRSEKVAQIKASPACEMVWWFAKSSEQFRLAGKLMLIGEDEIDPVLLSARKQQWGNLSDMVSSK